MHGTCKIWMENGFTSLVWPRGMPQALRRPEKRHFLDFFDMPESPKMTNIVKKVTKNDKNEQKSHKIHEHEWKMNGNSCILHGNGPQIYEQFASNLFIDHRSMTRLLAT